MSSAALDALAIAHDIVAAEHTHGIHAAAEIVRSAIDAAKAQQREADAMVCEGERWLPAIVTASYSDGDCGPQWFNDACDECAAAIRALATDGEA